MFLQHQVHPDVTEVWNIIKVMILLNKDSLDHECPMGLYKYLLKIFFPPHILKSDFEKTWTFKIREESLSTSHVSFLLKD